MRKIFIRKELICPFNYCRILIFTSEEDKSMDIRCENCEYVWNRKSTLIVGEGNLFLDENSKEYKEYEMLHTPSCVVDDLKEKKCTFCDKEIVGKGFTVHDTFGEIDLIFCDKVCADNYHISMR